MALIADESLIYHGYSIYLITVNSKGQMSNNEFIRCVCQFVPPNFVHEFFSVWAVEKGNKFLFVPKQFFCSQFASWKRNHDKYSLEKFVDSEFEIGETIWWAHHESKMALS